MQTNAHGHDRVERLNHWVHVGNMALLLLSGFQIHAPGFNIFQSMSNARLVHFVSMYMFLAVGVIHVYQFFVLGKYKVAMPRLSDVGSLVAEVQYYLFLRSDEPPYEKYNALQKFTYAGIFALAVLMSILGFVLYWPESLASAAMLLGGLAAVRQFHYLIAWAYVLFVGVHLYMISITDLQLLVAMVTGRRARGVQG